jgi:alpha-L-fucosidase 2
VKELLLKKNVKVQVSRRGFIRTLGALLGGLPILSKTRIVSGASKTNGSTTARDLSLWYRQPADQWTEALPLGNGRLGAMVFGGIRSEQIALNEDSLWSGAPSDWNNPSAKQFLGVVRSDVLQQQDYHAADQTCRKMQGPFNQAYEPLGDLIIEFEHADRATGYRRSLDLDSGISTVTYTIAGTTYTRESFVSAPDQVVAIRLAATKEGGLNCSLRLNSPLHAVSEAEESEIVLSGKAPSNSVPNYLRNDNPITYSDVPGKGMFFAAALHAATDSGTIENEVGQSLKIRKATEVVVLIAAATGFRKFNEMPDIPRAQVVNSARSALDAAKRLTFVQLRARHLDDHRRLFRRVQLDLGGQEGGAIPTDERVDGFEQNPDMPLLALYFSYGRYLLMTSSRPGTQPANLQGIWNAQIRPPWSSNWTANINVQMNYWPVETCNLSECHLPLVEMVRDLSQNGYRTAKTNYGLDGWCSHHNIDLWRQSAPVGDDLQFADPTWANFAMSGPWLCQHLWEHYRFTGDKEYLRSTAYPVIKGAAQFCVSWLTSDGKGGLTTCPSVSTENSFLAPDDKSAQVSAGCTLDIALYHEIFDVCKQATQILGIDSDFAAQLATIRARLPQYQIGKRGQLQEWSVDFSEDQPGQRHMSHLYPVYPGSEITPASTPELAAAARKSLELRLANGGAYTGWSRAWAVGLWARLGDGEQALESLKMLMLHSTGINLFDQHPFGESMTKAMRRSRGTDSDVSEKKTRPSAIFQIDGNFGATAAIAEMLIQSHEDFISILPAWPTAWNNGSVSGLRARGGIEVAISWKRGKSVTGNVRAIQSGEFRFRPPSGFRFVQTGNSEVRSDGTLVMRISKGESNRLLALPA